jgi:hypothetical protein
VTVNRRNSASDTPKESILSRKVIQEIVNHDPKFFKTARRHPYLEPPAPIRLYETANSN